MISPRCSALAPPVAHSVPTALDYFTLLVYVGYLVCFAFVVAIVFPMEKWSGAGVTARRFWPQASP